MTLHPSYRKAGRSSAAVGAERAFLRLVQGDGVVPLAPDDDPTVLVTRRGDGTLADLLAERGPLAPSQCRAVGAAAARALRRLHDVGLVHGDIKPANLVFAPDGDLWLVDFDAAGRAGAPRRRGTTERLIDPSTLHPDDDITAVVSTVVECATGVVIDPAVPWSVAALAALGCPVPLADDLASVHRDRPPASTVARILTRPDDRLPDPPHHRGGADSTPTVDMPGTAIVGLAPRPGTKPPPQRSSRVRSSKVSRRTTTRASPSATKTTGGRGTLL